VGYVPEIKLLGYIAFVCSGFVFLWVEAEGNRSGKVSRSWNALEGVEYGWVVRGCDGLGRELCGVWGLFFFGNLVLFFKVLA